MDDCEGFNFDDGIVNVFRPYTYEFSRNEYTWYGARRPVYVVKHCSTPILTFAEMSERSVSLIVDEMNRAYNEGMKGQQSLEAIRDSMERTEARSSEPFVPSESGPVAATALLPPIIDVM